MRAWFRDIKRRRDGKLAHQLSKSELHSATLAFDRARGHFQGLNIDQFRKTLLSEACAGIPEYQAQRLFHEWNVCGTGELSLQEFIAGVAEAVKGSQRDHEGSSWIPQLGTKVLSARDDILLNVPGPRNLEENTCTVGLFHARKGISSEQRDDFRFELRSLLFILSADATNLTSAYISDRLREVLEEDSLVDKIATVWATSKESNSSQRMESPSVREELKLFVLGYCCAHACNVHQVYRQLFEIFDEHSFGQIDVEQLSAVLQLTMDLSPLDSEREANVIIRRRGRSQSSELSPPTSPGRMPAIVPERAQVLSLQQFTEVAQELPGFSVAEVETALLLFHLKQHDYDDISPNMMRHDHLLLMDLFDTFFSEQTFQSTAFCLLSPKEWQQLMEGAINSPANSSADINAQILHQEATELPSGNVVLPLPVWLLLAYWYRQKLFAQEQYSPLQLYQDVSTCLKEFWIRISINFTSRDGFERVATIPQAIAFEQCTVQSVLDAALFQKRWSMYDEGTGSNVTTMCQCQVHVAERNAAGEISTPIQQDDSTTLSHDQLASSLGSVLPLLFSSWGLESGVVQDKVSFELHFSVVEIEQQGDGMNAEGLTGMDTVRNTLEVATTSLHLSQRTFPSPGAMPRGLSNLGNTCFMNAVLQCLTATPLLHPHIIEAEHRAELISSSPACKALLCALGELFAGMNPRRQGATDAESSLSPAKLLGPLSALYPHMFDGNQQDAQEFLVCLLGFLGDTLKRSPTPTHDGESHILSPRSHALLANLFKSKEAQSTAEKASTQLCVRDSNGRHDRVVATEWWVSHIVNEPSVVNSLFSGQFKSALTCTCCEHQSARFEPFSSLQLPLIEDNHDFQSASEEQRDLMVVVHLTESTRKLTAMRGAIRTVVQVFDRSTVADVLTKLPVSRSKSSLREFIVGSLEDYTIQNLLVSDGTGDHMDDKTPASVLPSPTHAFEVSNIAGSGDDTTSPTTGSTKVYLRFVHRYSYLVPFYCTTPTRQALCGSPFVCSSIRGALTGQALHQVVRQRFLFGHSSQFRSRLCNVDVSKPQTQGFAHHYAPTFILRRVRDDGIACSRCHWSTGCPGCLILPTATAAELLDLENCETIAIDWDTQLHPQDPSAFWWLQSYPTRDHPSYIEYRLTKTHPLMQSLQSLCSTEHLDASCSQCQQSTPHTKQLSLWSLPPLLVLQLKRFELSTINGNYQWRKLSHNVDFPVRDLDLRDLLSPIDGGHDDSEPCTDRCSIDALDPRVRRGIEYLQNELNIPLTSASRSCTKYDLYAVVNHCGRGISSGHYTAHIRRPDETCWWLADDTVVTPLSEDELSPSSTAYLLFYVRQDVATGATELSDLFPTD